MWVLVLAESNPPVDKVCITTVRMRDSLYRSRDLIREDNSESIYKLDKRSKGKVIYPFYEGEGLNEETYMLLVVISLLVTYKDLLYAGIAGRSNAEFVCKKNICVTSYTSVPASKY